MSDNCLPEKQQIKRPVWDKENNQKFIDRLLKRIDEIDATFEPSTTFEQGNLIDSDYQKWASDVHPKMSQDWETIWKHLLYGYRKKLNWWNKGWVFNHFAVKYNWKGFATSEALALRMATNKKEGI